VNVIMHHIMIKSMLEETLIMFGVRN